MLADDRSQLVGQFLGAGGLVLDGRNHAHRQDDLGQDALSQALVGDGEGDADGRVGVHHGLHVGALLVAGQVHPDLAGGAASASELVALAVDDHQMVVREEALVAARLGAEDVAVGQSGGQVSVHADQQVALVAEAPDADHLFAQGGFVHRCFLRVTSDALARDNWKLRLRNHARSSRAPRPSVSVSRRSKSPRPSAARVTSVKAWTEAVTG